MQRAKWLLLSGEGIESEDALKIGLIERVAGDALMEEALEMGKRLIANGPLAYAAIKKALRAGMEMPFSEAMREETRLFAGLCNSQDKAEGVRAFLEKRKPVFTGK
jgi:enoyl-CoA hydratase/carnithine racemase